MTYQRCRAGRLVLAGAVLLVPMVADSAAAQARHRFSVPPPTSTVRLEKSVMVRTRDGVKLSTDLYFSEGASGTLPVILVRTPHSPPGHRIRVEVTSSSFPRFDRNRNTVGNNSDETKWVVARNVVHHSARYPSHVLLPVIPER
jgi:predicted acyl esterase